MGQNKRKGIKFIRAFGRQTMRTLFYCKYIYTFWRNLEDKPIRVKNKRLHYAEVKSISLVVQSRIKNQNDEVITLIFWPEHVAFRA